MVWWNGRRAALKIPKSAILYEYLRLKPNPDLHASVFYLLWRAEICYTKARDQYEVAAVGKHREFFYDRVRTKQYPAVSLASQIARSRDSCRRSRDSVKQETGLLETSSQRQFGECGN